MAGEQAGATYRADRGPLGRAPVANTDYKGMRDEPQEQSFQRFMEATLGRSIRRGTERQTWQRETARDVGIGQPNPALPAGARGGGAPAPFPSGLPADGAPRGTTWGRPAPRDIETSR